MNAQLIATFLNMLLALVPQITNSKAVNSVVNWLVQIVPVLVQEFQDLLPIVQNVIALLQQNSAVTPAQMAALKVLDAQVDKAFDDAFNAYLGNHPEAGSSAPLSAAG